MNTTHELDGEVCIDATHPSLPGHFPSQPVVPGVVLLDHVAARLEEAGFGRLARIASVKFMTPLLPGERAALQATVEGARVKFRITRDGIGILGGEGELA